MEGKQLTSTILSKATPWPPMVIPSTFIAGPLRHDENQIVLKSKH